MHVSLVFAARSVPVRCWSEVRRLAAPGPRMRRVEEWSERAVSEMSDRGCASLAVPRSAGSASYEDVCMPVRGSERGRVVSWVVSVESEGCVAGDWCRPQVGVRRHLSNSHLLTSPTAPSLRIDYTLLLLEQPSEHDVEQSPEHEVEEQPLAAPPLPHKHLTRIPKTTQLTLGDPGPTHHSGTARRTTVTDSLLSGLSPLLLLSAPRGGPDKVI
jgi:hypothetical protein